MPQTDFTPITDVKIARTLVTQTFGALDASMVSLRDSEMHHARFGWEWRESEQYQKYVITDGSVSVMVTWFQPFWDTLNAAELRVQEVDGQIPLPAEARETEEREIRGGDLVLSLMQPSVLSRAAFRAADSTSHGPVWMQTGKGPSYQPAGFAMEIVNKFKVLIRNSVYQGL
ncbi:MAG: hypothetical protein ABSC48_00555 [Terracidiphilus sp.]|jgi:hypothetical protein